MPNVECRKMPNSDYLYAEHLTSLEDGPASPGAEAKKTGSFAVGLTWRWGQRDPPMKLIEIPAPDLDLAMTLDSGQVFHWDRAGNGFVGTIGDCAVYIEKRANFLTARKSRRQLDGLKPSSLRRLVTNYFALDHPLVDICASFPNDPIMNEARDFCRGLRIIRQPKWECLATFICSSIKQVAHIRQISLALRKRFGEQRRIGGAVLYTFPSAQRIARASEKQLRECALGYRARHLRATAQLVSSAE